MRKKGYLVENDKFVTDDKEQVSVINNKELKTSNGDGDGGQIQVIKDKNRITDDKEHTEVIEVIEQQGIKIELTDAEDYRTTIGGGTPTYV